MKTRRTVIKNTRRFSICATSIAAFMAGSPESPGNNYDVNLGDTFVEGGVVTGATGLNKTGGGSLVLSNAGNNYTGITTISDGSVVISVASALGADASAIVVTGFNPTPGSTNLRAFGGGSLVLNGTAGPITISRDLSLQGQGPIADRGAALISVGNNTLSGVVTMGQPASGTNLNTNIISANGTLNLTGTLNVLGAAATTLSNLGGTNQGGVVNYNLTGLLAGTGTLVKSGSGTLFLNPSSSAGFSGTIRTGASNAGGQSTIRIGSAGALGTRTAATTGSVLDLNGGILEVLKTSSGLVGASAANSNVYGRAATTIFVDKGVGDLATGGTATFGALAYEDGATFTFTSRNGYGITFGATPVQGGNGNTNFTNNLQGGLLTFTGNFWSNADSSGDRTFTLDSNGNTLINGNIIAAGAADDDHSFTKIGAGTLTVNATGTTLDGNFNLNEGTVATQRIVGGLLGATSGTAAGNLNIGATTFTGTLNYLGATGTGAGETLAKNLNLAGTTGSARINANQAGSAPTALVITALTAANNSNKTLTLGGTSALQNEITAAIPNPGTGVLSLVKTDAGTWVLSAANTYTGATTIANGTLRLKASSTAAASNVLADASTVTFNVDAAQAAGGRLLLSGDAGFASTETIGTISPVIGHGTIRVESGGLTTTLAAAGLSAASGSIGASVNFEAPTVLEVVTLGGTVDTLRGNAYYNGANFAYIGAGNVLRAPNYGVDPLTATSGVALTASQHNLITGSFSDAGTAISSLKISGSQTLTLTGTAAVNLGFQTSGGILVDGGNAVIAQGGGGAITQGLGVAAAGGGALVIRVNQASDSLALQVPITSSTTVGLSKNGLGTLILSATNAQTGVTNINEGTIQLAAGGKLSANNAALSIRQGGTLDLNAVTDLTSVGNFNGAGTVTNGAGSAAATLGIGGNAGTGTFTGVIQDGSSFRTNVQKQSTGTITLNGLNTYMGTTTIVSTGTLTVPNLANIGVASGLGRGDATSNTTNADSLVFTGAQAVSAATGLSLPSGLIFNGTEQTSTDRLFRLGGTGNGAGARIQATGGNNSGIVFSNPAPIGYTAVGATVAQNLVLSGASTADNRIDLQLVDSGGAGGSLRVNKIDAGKWALGNTSNSYTGATKINGGALEANDGLSLPTASPLLFSGTLAIPTGGVLTTTSSTFTRPVNAGTVANTVNFNANGNFAGSGGFAASGDKLTVNLGASAPLTWGGGGFLMAGTAAATLRLSSTTAIGEVDFQNPIDLGALVRAVQVDDNGNIGTDFATLSGVLSGAGGGVSKAGTGTLAQTGANTYTGTTTVTAGTLVVRSLGNSGAAGATSVGNSAAGNTDAGAVLLGNAGTGAGILQYVGPGETSDRKIRLNTTTGTTQIHADGSGPVILTNVINDVATGAKNLTLRGTNAAGNRIDSVLTNSPIGAGPSALALSVTVDGGATWILNAVNAYTGNTTSTAGALGAGNDAAFGPSGIVVLNGGNLFASGADRTIANPVQLQNNQTQGILGDFSLDFTAPLTNAAGANNVGINNNITAGETLRFAGMNMASLTANRTLTVDGTGETIFNGNITNTSTTAFGLNLTKTGSGLLVLNGGGGNFAQNNANVEIDAGTIRLGAANALLGTSTSAANVIFSPDAGANETATLNVNGFSQTFRGLTTNNPNSSATTIDNASGTAVTLTLGNSNGGGNFNGALTATGGGAISLVKTGTGTSILSGANIVVGGITTVQTGGSLLFTGDDPNNTTSITVAGGAGLGLINGAGNSFASLTTLNLGAGAGATALGLNVGTVTDTLGIAGAATAIGAVNLSIGAAPGLTGGSYTLLSATGGGLTSGGATYALNGNVAGGFTYTLTSSDTSVVLNATAAPADFYFWTGDQSDSWATFNAGNTNWENGTPVDPAAIPGPTSVVIFSAPFPGNAPLSEAFVTTLDQPTSIDSLQFNGSNNPGTAASRVSIAPGVGVNNTLTIAPASDVDGIALPDNGGIASITAPIVLGADQTWSVGSVGALRPELIVTGVLSGTGNLTKLGVGTATVTGTSTRTGRTAIDNGTLRINAEAALGGNPGALAVNQLSINGGTLRSTAAFTIDDTNRGITIGGLGGSIDTTGGNITVGSTAAPSLNVVTGGGNLRKEGGNTLILNSANTYSGGTFVNGGAVRAGNNSALGTLGVTLGNTGTILEVANGVTVSNAITVADAANDKTFRLLAGAAAGTISGPITVSELTAGNVRAQASAGGILTISSIIATTGTAAPGLRINEAGGNTGVVILSGANTYGGTTEVRQGTLRNGASDVIPGALTVNAAVAASPSATYDLAGNSETVSALTYGANASSTAAYVNTVTTGAGTLTLGGNVTTVANPGGSQVGTAVLAGNVAMAATRTFTVANATSVATDLLVSAAITGAGGLTKAGAGTMEMTGASTYVGDTTINAGTLLVNGSISGAVITAGGILGGTGSVGSISATSGTVAPGASIGTLTATSLTMSGTATFALEINTTAQTTDLLNTTGPLTLAAGGTPLTVVDLGSNVPLTLGTTFPFIAYNGTLNGLFSFGGIPINNLAESFAVGANLFQINYDDLDKVSLVVVPEPGIAASLLGGFGMLVGLQRIRRRSDRRA